MQGNKLKYSALLLFAIVLLSCSESKTTERELEKVLEPTKDSLQQIRHTDSITLITQMGQFIDSLGFDLDTTYLKRTASYFYTDLKKGKILFEDDIPKYEVSTQDNIYIDFCKDGGGIKKFISDPNIIKKAESIVGFYYSNFKSVPMKKGAVVTDGCIEVLSFKSEVEAKQAYEVINSGKGVLFTSSPSYVFLNKLDVYVFYTRSVNFDKELNLIYNKLKKILSA